MSDIVYKLNQKQSFDFSETFNIYRECASQLIQNETSGIDTLIKILNSKSKLSSSLDNMLADLIESVGFYPYLEKEDLNLFSTSAKIRRATNISSNIVNKIFHDEQKHILKLLESGKNVIVSAPTSFGKSLLIEEVVASLKYKNIVVIQPTLALLDETRKKLSKYEDANSTSKCNSRLKIRLLSEVRQKPPVAV
ncbi:DEAD/DEAH box helicase [Aeromonas sp. 80P]